MQYMLSVTTDGYGQLKNKLTDLNVDKNADTHVNILLDRLLRITWFYSWLLENDDSSNKTDRQVFYYTDD